MKAKEEILDEIARKECNGNYDNWDEYQFHLITDAVRNGKESCLELDRIIFMAMELWATEKANFISSKQDIKLVCEHNEGTYTESVLMECCSKCNQPIREQAVL